MRYEMGVGIERESSRPTAQQAGPGITERKRPRALQPRVLMVESCYDEVRDHQGGVMLGNGDDAGGCRSTDDGAWCVGNGGRLN